MWRGIVSLSSPGVIMASTPTGLQSTADLTRRRRIVGALNGLTFLGLAWALVAVLSSGGWTLIDVLMLVCFLFAAPWSVLGFWNAAIGLWLLHVRRDAWDQVAPYLPAAEGTGPLQVRTAVLLTLRNEDPERAIRRLRIVKDSIDATGQGAAFAYFILSDTNDPTVAEAEERAFESWKASDAVPQLSLIHI